MNGIDAIVFDFDGVLVESVDVKGAAFAALYAHEGPEIQQRILDHHNAHGGTTRHDKIQYFENNILGRVATDKQIQILADRFGVLVEDQVVMCPYVPGALEFLESHHSRIPLFVNSATPEPELKRIVARRDMEKYFRGVHGAPASKSDNLMTIMARYDLNPARVVMVGDALSDYRATQECGTRFIGRIAAMPSIFPDKTHVITDMHQLSTVTFG